MNSSPVNRVLLIVILLLFVAGVLSPQNSPQQFVLFQLTVVAFSVLILLHLIKSKKTYITLILPLVTNANGAVMHSVYTLISPSDVVYNNAFLIHYLDSSLQINLAFLIPPLAIFIISKFTKPREQESGLFNIKNFDRKHYLMAFAVIVFFFLSFFSDIFFEIPFLGYISRVAKEAFLLFTFWIGYWNVRLRGLFYVSLVIILITTGFSVLSGGRFYAFIQFAALYLGYLVGQPVARRKFLIRLAVVAIPVIFSLSGVLSYVRSQIGRGDVNIVTEDRFQEFVEAFKIVLSDADFIKENRSLSLEGMRRNIKWPNLSVISLSPDVVPYRGLENLDLEFRAIFQIAGVSSGFDVESVMDAREANIELGLNTGMANRYGYNVNRLNSVEWSLLADGWSRGGILVYILYFAIVISLFIRIETWILNSKIHPAEKALLIVVMIRILWFNTGSDPLYYILRSLMLSYSLALGLIFGIRLLSIKKYHKLKQFG